MKINVRAALTATACALPFVGLASHCWITAATRKHIMADDVYLFGDMIYLLGSPLTLIVMGLPFYAGRYLNDSDVWWAIPFTNGLFILQWVIWSQLIARAPKAKYR
jgi:hypothetical protein